jgi:hypothetical protein
MRVWCEDELAGSGWWWSYTGAEFMDTDTMYAPMTAWRDMIYTLVYCAYRGISAAESCADDVDMRNGVGLRVRRMKL